MKPTTQEWIHKAEGDFDTMEREARVRKNPNFDAVCFHAQQCAEKYLKARLCEADVHVEKIHDLVALLERVVALDSSWESFRKPLAYLSDFAVQFRYPGESADRDAAVQARDYCRAFVKVARDAFG